jgi:hypothetical protein
MRRLTLIAVAALLAVSCGINRNNEPGGDAPVVLKITKVQGGAGTQVPPLWFDTLLSDVETCGGVINDDAILTLGLSAKNPDYTQTATTGLNDVLLQTFAVHFIRTDGHQVQGVDVPYDFSGGLSGLVPLNSTTGVQTAFVIVRHSAKEEPPLRTLVDSGGEHFIETVAQITAYGRTVGGYSVQATGYLQVTFGDFADPKSCPFATPVATPTPSPAP